MRLGGAVNIGADGGARHGYSPSPVSGWTDYYRALMTGDVLDSGLLPGFPSTHGTSARTPNRELLGTDQISPAHATARLQTPTSDLSPKHSPLSRNFEPDSAPGTERPTSMFPVKNF